MACVNPNDPAFKEILARVGNPILAEIEFDKLYPEENVPEIKPGVEEVFNSNPELANAVYEALGFDNNKTQIAQVKTNNKIITQYSDGTFNVIVDEEAYNKAKKEYNDNFKKRKNAIPQLIEDFKSGKRKDWGDDFLTEIIKNTFNGQFKYDKELNSFVTEEIEGDEENIEEGFKPAKFDKVTGKVGSRLGFNKVAETEIFKQLTEANIKILKDDLGILDLWKSQEGVDRTKAEIQANYDLYEFDKYKQLNKEFVAPKNKGYVIRTVNGGLLNDLYGSSGIQTAIAYQENGTMPLKDSKGNYKYDAYMFIDRIDSTGVYIRYTEVKKELRGKGISNLLLNRVRELYPNLPIHRTMIHNPIIVKQSLKIDGVTDKKGNKLIGLKTDNDVKKWLESNDELIIPPLNNQITPQQKQEATFMFSEFLDVYLQDFEQVERILKEEKIIDKKCS